MSMHADDRRQRRAVRDDAVRNWFDPMAALHTSARRATAARESAARPKSPSRRAPPQPRQSSAAAARFSSRPLDMAPAEQNGWPARDAIERSAPPSPSAPARPPSPVYTEKLVPFEGAYWHQPPESAQLAPGVLVEPWLHNSSVAKHGAEARAQSDASDDERAHATEAPRGRVARQLRIVALWACLCAIMLLLFSAAAAPLRASSLALVCSACRAVSPQYTPPPCNVSSA